MIRRMVAARSQQPAVPLPPEPTLTGRQALVLSARQELKWFGVAMVVAVVLGLIAGFPALIPLAVAIGYLIWLVYRFNAVLAWLEQGASVKAAPPSIGLPDALVGRVCREKKYSAKQKDRYRHALSQFNALAAELPDATIVINEHRQIRWANPAALTLLAVHPERDRGQRIDNLLRDPAIHALLAEPHGMADVEVPSPQAPDRTLAIRMTPSDRNMNVIIARDVTQRVRVREMRKGFVADVSHELRTPLTVIRGYLEVLREDKSLPDKVQKALRQVDEQSERMRHLVEHLLELSKLEGNPLGAEEGEPVFMAELINSVRDVLQRESQQHEFIVDADPGLAVTGSAAEIYSLCQNLMTNAVRYTGTGTRVDVSWHQDVDGSGIFRVSDNGPGIEAHHLPRLSERFYRVDRGRSRDRGGTGLGLAIVKHVAQRHGGDLDIDSRPGEGSQFQIRFPATRCALAATLTANTCESGDAGQACHPPVTNGADNTDSTQFPH